MSKLLNASFHELFKSRYFYITLLVCTAFGGGLAAGMYLYPNFNMPENSVVITKDNVLGFVPSFSSIVIPFAAAATAAMLLDSQYNQGTVRNRLISGHTRTEIFFSDLITMSAAAVIYFVCYQAAAFAVAVFIFDYDGYALKPALISLSVLLVMVICFGAVLSLVLGNYLRGGKLTVTILAVQYGLNMSIILAIFKNRSKLIEYISKVFPQGSLFDFSYSHVPEGIEKSLILSLALTVILTAVGLFHFKKCDIK